MNVELRRVGDDWQVVVTTVDEHQARDLAAKLVAASIRVAELDAEQSVPPQVMTSTWTLRATVGSCDSCDQPVQVEVVSPAGSVQARMCGPCGERTVQRLNEAQAAKERRS